MTYELYWNGDASLPKYYRDANNMAKDRKNHELWLQGMYFYDALCAVSPVFHAFAKSGVKPLPYPDTPYALTEEQVKAKRKEKEKEIAERGKRIMEAFARKKGSTDDKREEVN